MLLTFSSGAVDVISFTRLGNVFSSVMTGNIVLFGLSLAQRSVSLAVHTAVAFVGYIAGVAVGARVAWFHAKGEPENDAGSGWPPHVTVVLYIELVLLAGFAAAWELAGGRPAGPGQLAMLAVAASAMGLQSSTVQHMGIAEVSTTYLTGTLTGLVGAIARPGRKSRAGLRRPGVLLGLVAGAVLAGLLVATVPDVVPALPLAAIASATILGSGRVPEDA